MTHSEERIQEVIAKATARNMYAKSETPDERRKLAIEFLDERVKFETISKKNGAIMKNTENTVAVLIKKIQKILAEETDGLTYVEVTGALAMIQSDFIEDARNLDDTEKK